MAHGASCGGKGRGVSSRKGAETNESQDASHLQRVEAGVRDGQPSLPAVAEQLQPAGGALERLSTGWLLVRCCADSMLMLCSLVPEGRRQRLEAPGGQPREGRGEGEGAAAQLGSESGDDTEESRLGSIA